MSSSTRFNIVRISSAFCERSQTGRHYLDLLTSALVVRQLQPWHANIGTRQVEAPRGCIIDSGLFHGLRNLPRQTDVEGHPKAGASWEGFVIEQIVTPLRAQPQECFFRATHTGAELDMLVVRCAKRRAFEIKRTLSPRVTSSMRSALEDLRLAQLDVIHAGDRTFDLAPRIRAVSLSRLLDDIQPLSPSKADALEERDDRT